MSFSVFQYRPVLAVAAEVHRKTVEELHTKVVVEEVAVVDEEEKMEKDKTI